jgi:hypothetical protein
MRDLEHKLDVTTWTECKQPPVACPFCGCLVAPPLKELHREECESARINLAALRHLQD